MARHCRTRQLCMQVVLLLVVSGLLGASTVAVADEAPGGPHIVAYHGHPVLVGFNWTPGATIEIRVAGERVEDSVADENGFFHGGHGGASPGEVIAVTDGNHTATHQFTDLFVDRVTPAKGEMNASTVRGATDSEPGSMVTVELHNPDEPGMVLGRRDVVVDQDRHWTADFSVAVGDEDWAQPLDLVFGMEGVALQRDEQGNATAFGWWVPEPRFTINPSPRGTWHIEGSMGWGRDWTPGAEMTVEVNGQPREIDPSPAIVSEVDFGYGSRGEVFISTIDGGVQPGDEVTFSDGESTTSHIVTSLAITHANPASAAVEPNVVKGTTDSTQGTVEVSLWTDEAGHGRRQAEIRPDGSWMADFSIAVDDVDDRTGIDYGKAYDLQPGSLIHAYEHDVTHNATYANREVAYEPTFGFQRDWNLIQSGGWPAGVSVTVATSAEGNPEQTVMTGDEDSDWPGFIRLPLSDVWEPVAPGEEITLTHTPEVGPAVVKRLTVSSLTVTDVDDDARTVSGIADYDHATNLDEVKVVVYDVDNEPVAWRLVDVEPDGTWTADFSSPAEADRGEGLPTLGLLDRFGGEAFQSNHTGDITYIRWAGAPPVSFIDVDEGSVHAENISRLVAAGITEGFADGEFRPADSVTRQQMASFLTRALDLGAPDEPLQFDDVSEDNTHYDAIQSLAAAEITLGCGPGEFCPADPVTREQMASFLVRSLDL